MIINSDFDGVLIPEDFEKQFFGINKEWRCSIDDYIRIVVESPNPPLNTTLLRYYESLRRDGHIIRLLTNRNYELRNKTIQTLGEWVGMFDSLTFCDGKKSQTRVEGLMIDNETKYLKCGSLGGIHYVFNGKGVR